MQGNQNVTFMVTVHDFIVRKRLRGGGATDIQRRTSLLLPLYSSSWAMPPPI